MTSWSEAAERFFELSIDLLCVVDKTGRFVHLSRSWQAFLGIPLSELAGRNFIDFVHPDDVETTIRLFRDIGRGMESADFRNRYLCRSGQYRTLSWRSSPPDADGMVHAVARDVTDEQVAHDALAAEQARLRAVMDSIADLVFIKDKDLRYLGCNRPFAEFIGHSEAELRGHSDFDFFPAEQAQFFRDHDTAMLRDMAPRRNDEWLVFPDGRRRLYDTQKVPLITAEGKLAGLVGVSRDITDQTELRDQVDFLGTMVNHSHDPLYCLDPQRDFTFVYVNDALCGYLGVSRQEILRSDPSRYCPEIDRAALDELWRLCGTSAPVVFETKIRLPDGQLAPVEISANRVHHQGRDYAVGWLRDLSKRRRAELILRARLRLAEIARDNDMDCLMTELLDTAERLTASAIGFFHFVDPDQKTLRLQAWSSNTLKNMCKAEGKGQHYPVDQAGIWAECLRQGRAVICNDYDAAEDKKGLLQGHAPVSRLVTVPVTGEGGFSALIGVGNKAKDYDGDDVDVLTELATMAIDIVSRVRAEVSRRALAEELAHAAHQWSAAMETFQGGIALLDGDHRLVRANAAFFALTGTDPGQVGEVMTGLFTSSADGLDPVLACDDAETVIEAGDPGNPSGKPLEVRVSTIHDGQGRVDGKVVSLYDLTHVRQQEGRLEAMISELTRSNAELERFGQVAAHDLQEPTRRQVLFAQLLQRKLGDGLDGDSRQYLGFMIADALKMRDMVRALNVYHRAGHTLHPVEAVEMDRVAADVIGTLSSEIDRCKARLCMAPLGDVAGERARLHLLLINLLSNALRFRHPERQPRIQLSAAEAEAGMAEFSVSDNGIGIPEQYRDGMFTLFRRMNAKQGGSGMGLAQCRRIVEDLGGRIWLEGNEAGGTSVKFTLPRP